MKRKIILSEDGSSTIYVEDLGEHYHSVFGARAESEHVFIHAGLKYLEQKAYGEINILEAGLGTGLNLYLSFVHKNPSTSINYLAIEKYPLAETEWQALNYTGSENKHLDFFSEIHTSEWSIPVKPEENFQFLKIRTDLKTYIPPQGLDLIYFDAFAPDVQPELWSKDIFSRIYESLNYGGILVTYSVKGFVKRNLQESGFSIEKLPGPKGKRHMLRALK